MASKYMFVSTVVYASVVAALFYLIDSIQPEPYLDEIFHIPQAKKYCNGKFKEWDNKITTPPGLYLMSVGLLKPLSDLLDRHLCEATHLRLVNVILSSLTFPLLHKLSVQIHGDKHFFDGQKCFLSAVNLAIFPLLYFFSFLYYTDVGSTFLVLLMYSLHLDRRDWLASFVGALSVLFRQTNIVWVAFVAMQALGPNLMHEIYTQLHETQHTVKFSLNSWGQTKEFAEGLVLLLRDPASIIRFTFASIGLVGGYILVGVLFLVAVCVNGGVALGDKDAHTVTFHPTQVLYFCLFTTAFTWSFCLTKVIPFLGFLRKHWAVLALCTLACCGVVSSYTLAHPYLLADNRHYVFYIWRKIVNVTPWARFCLVPAYVFSVYCILLSIRKNGIIFKLTFPVCLFINLSPQLLLEFRYFVIPFLIFRLQIRPRTWWKLSLEFITSVVINAFTIYLFLTKPFHWPHEPEAVQRFIW